MLQAIRRLLTHIRRDRLDAEMREEIRQHIELRRQQLIAEGMEPGEATAAAQRAFGNTTRIREEMHDMWGFPALDSVMQDARYAARLLRRSPLFTATAVLSLALGIGATAAAFNVADAVLFRPLPVGGAHDLYEFRSTLQLPGTVKVLGGMPDELLTRMQPEVDFADLVGFRILDDVFFASGGAGRPVRVELASANYFDVLRVATRSGRLLDLGDSGHAPVPVVLSERLWRAAFNAEPAIAGRAVSINGVPATVVGVTSEFQGLMAERPADVFVPLGAAALFEGSEARARSITRVVIRLRPGVTTAEAEQRITALYKALSPPTFAADALRISLAPGARGVSDARASLTQPFMFGLGLAAVLLLVACANTGGLLMTRFAARHGEFGVRLAIGAGRARLARQLAVEAAVLGAMAAAAALAIAAVTGPLLARSMPLDQAAAFDVRFDWRLVAFTAIVSGGAVIVAAGASLFRVFRSDTAAVLHANARTVVHGRRWLTEALIAAQVACSLLLLVTASSMMRTLENLRSIDPGFDPGSAFAATVDASALADGAQNLPAYFSTLHDRIQAAPGVESASFAQVGLMTRAATTGTVDVPGRETPPPDRLVRLFWVGPDFLETAGMRLIAGRTIGPAEAASRERVAVVNQEFARFYFGAPERALGRMVNRDVRIIGITADARYNTLRDEPVRAMFLPHTQSPTRPAITFVVRPAGDPAQAMNAVTGAIRAFEPRLKLTVTPLADVVAATLSRERFVARLAAVLSSLALFLSCAGLYAAVAYGVSERRGEMAVRLALGATSRDIVSLVLRDPLRTTTLGIIVGVPAAYAAMRSISALLFGVAPFDIVTMAACALALIGITTAAALWPARRAAAINPQECLKIT